MKLQSAIEFLSTYGFLFIIMTITILLIVLLISGTKSTIPQQCVSYSVINCNFVNYYINTTVPYALATFSMTNAQEVPINITSFVASFAGANYTGGCAPDFLYPGQEATCVANVSAFTFNIGGTVNGQFSINALVCDNNIASLAGGICTNNAIFTGAFVTSAEGGQQPIVFSAIAALGPVNNGLSSRPLPPLLPSGYAPYENGDWVLTQGNSIVGNDIRYDFATYGYIRTGAKDMGMGRQTFPSTLTVLNTNTVDSNALNTAPYNSVLTYAYTIVYVPAGPSATYTFNAVSDNTIAFYIKGAANVLSPWTPEPANYIGWNSLLPTPYTLSYTCNCAPGTKLVAIAVAWGNNRGEGLQAVNITT